MGDLETRLKKLEAEANRIGEGPLRISVLEIRHGDYASMGPADIKAAYAEARAEAVAMGYHGALTVDLPPASWRKNKGQNGQHAQG